LYKVADIYILMLYYVFLRVSIVFIAVL